MITQEKEDLLDKAKQEGHIETEKVCEFYLWQGLTLDSHLFSLILFWLVVMVFAFVSGQNNFDATYCRA